MAGPIELMPAPALAFPAPTSSEPVFSPQVSGPQAFSMVVASCYATIDVLRSCFSSGAFPLQSVTL